MIGLASERYLNHVPHPEMCRAVEVEFLAGDLTVEEFEAELHFYLGLGPPQRERCGGCGQFIPGDSTYLNRCDDCWTPADEFIF